MNVVTAVVGVMVVIMYVAAAAALVFVIARVQAPPRFHRVRGHSPALEQTVQFGCIDCS